MLKIIFLLLLFVMQNSDRQLERDLMVTHQIEGRGITHGETLRAMRIVARHLLVPDSHRTNAYHDGPLPIGYGQTISQPYIVAFMTQAIQPSTGQKVLEVGTGSGYQSAVLADIVSQVYTIEIVAELGLRARQDLEAMGYDNIQFRICDGYHGWAEEAPFDGIIVTAAAPTIPPHLTDQLKDGGKMIIPIGLSGASQELILIEKRGNRLIKNSLLPVRFVPFTREK